jgi:hypothetical protein
MAGIAPAASPLATQLTQLLYEWCYCRRFGSAAAAPQAAPTADPAFSGPLAAANAGREHWDAGWIIQQSLPSGQIVVVKGAMTRLVWPGEFLAHGAHGTAPRPGVEVSLFAPRDSWTLQPGFYFVFGEALSDQEDDFSVVRLYWNVEAAAAARLVAALTQALNRFAVPFRLKCLSMAALYDRTDAAVLYVARRYYHLVAQLLAPLYPSLRPLLKAPTPLFSKPLAEGLGLAENPKTGESFGMHRCRLVAEAVCNAHARGLDAPQARLREIDAGFAAAGLSLAHPFLNPGSVDGYEFRPGGVS